LPWRKMSPKSQLKIGVIWNDGIVRPTPPVSRALRDTVEKLRAAGHEVIDWEPIGHKEGLDLLVRQSTTQVEIADESFSTGCSRPMEESQLRNFLILLASHCSLDWIIIAQSKI
jgi:Asp-tRNA(Asn)/Glu-tRNA(Gln) amidotransferase A subunit family amidase